MIVLQSYAKKLIRMVQTNFENEKAMQRSNGAILVLGQRTSCTVLLKAKGQEIQFPTQATFSFRLND